MRPLIAVVALGLFVAGPTVAQTTAPSSGLAPASPMAPATPPAGSTVNGGVPDRTGSTTAIGQTKPPGDPVGERMGTRPDLEAKSKELDQKINKGICVGCK